jgi:hypothetical protein
MADSRLRSPSTAPARELCGITSRRRRAMGEAPRVHRRRQVRASGPDLAAVARELAGRSRRAQGLPDHIADPAVLHLVAQLMFSSRRRRPVGETARPP